MAIGSASRRHGVIDEDVSGADFGELHGHNGVHRGLTIEGTLSKQDVLNTAPRNEKRLTRSVRERHTNRRHAFPPSFTHLVLAAMPNLRTDILPHPNLPVEPF